MRRIEFKAYGGTGTLIGRSFITLLALNACDVAKEENANDVCVIYQMDYDDASPKGDDINDSKYFKNCVENYKKLHKRNLKFLAPIALELDSTKLKDVRRSAYGEEETEYSLKSLFCSQQHNQEIYELLTSAFTTDRNSMTQEIERSNCNGCYGDLAVNGFISERLISTNAFSNQGLYNNLAASLKDAIVFYAGSTDGGTANTMIDKDIRSLLHYLEDSGKKIGHEREFRVYGLRTTPYSRFELQGKDDDIAITESILRDKFQMSQGVFQKIEFQNERSNNEKIENYSYYYLDGKQRYWLDGLFVAGSETLDLTADQALKDNQFHPSHLVEFSLAQQAMDAIAHRLPKTDEKIPHLYAYNDGGGGEQNRSVTLDSFFGNASVYHQYYKFETAESGSVRLTKYIRSFLLTLVTIKGRMIQDFRNYNPRSGKNEKRYIFDIFNKAHGDEEIICPLVAKELEAFVEECKFIVMTLVNIMDYSKFKRSEAPVSLVESAIKYVYSKDIQGNAIEMPAGNGLSIASDGVNKKIEIKTNPEFVTLDEMASINFHQGSFFGGKHMDSECFYQNNQASSHEESAAVIANDMIQRLFEVYLVEA